MFRSILKIVADVECARLRQSCWISVNVRCGSVAVHVHGSGDLPLFWVDEGVHFHYCAESVEVEDVEKSKLLEEWCCWRVGWLVA